MKNQFPKPLRFAYNSHEKGKINSKLEEKNKSQLTTLYKRNAVESTKFKRIEY